MIEDKFGLADEEYWSDPWRTRKEVQRPLIQKGLEAFFIGAPKVVSLDRYATFPVAVLRTRKVTGASKIDFRKTALITAIELGTYRLSARLAFPASLYRRPGNGAARTGVKDSFSNDSTAMIGEGSTLDLAALLRLPVYRSEYLVTLISLDRVSNRCRMRLLEAAGYEDPAVDDFLREYRASRVPPPKPFPEPAIPLPNFKPMDQSPQITAGTGITLSVPRVNIFARNTRCILSGSFRLPIQPQHSSKPPREDIATVPISLLITGSVDPEPRILRLFVPTYQPLESSGGRTIASGYFSFDLCGMTNLLSIPQTWFIYGFSGEVMTAPVPTAFAKLPDEEFDEVQSW
ncbi:MAG TPA: hypothetical protein VGK48_02175 [Terriglobia bacterium]|jgi:hypothetical protein